MSEVKSNKMLARFGLMYGAPSRDTKEAEAIANEYSRMMVQYADPELEAAADKLIRTRKYKSWPTIAECIEALENSRADAYAKNAPERKVRYAYPEWTSTAIEAANKLIDCEMGRRAARDGWILGLHDYCRKHRKLPSHYETGPMIDAARFAERCAAGVDLADLAELTLAQKRIRDDKGPKEKLAFMALDASLVKMANTFLTRREKLARVVLGERA